LALSLETAKTIYDVTFLFAADEADCVENNQPDVIKAASAANKNVTSDIVLAVSKDKANLQQENVELCCQLRRHALGFDAMATLVDYLANHCGVVGVMEFNKQLKQDIANLQITVENKKEEIGRKNIKRNLKLYSA
jgi:hypothetical protein